MSTAAELAHTYTANHPANRLNLSGRAPLYLAVRVRGLNEFDIKNKMVTLAARVFAFWKEDETWVEEHAARLKAAGNAKCKLTSGDLEKEENASLKAMLPIMDVVGVDLLYRGELHFKVDPEDQFGGKINMMHTAMTENRSPIELDFAQFPFDVQTLRFELHLPRSESTRFALVINPSLVVPSERVLPKNAGGHGIFEITPPLYGQLAPFEIVDSYIDWRTETAQPEEPNGHAKVYLCFLIRRRTGHVIWRYMVPCGVLATLANASWMISSTELVQRSMLTLTLLVCLTIFLATLSVENTFGLPSLSAPTLLERYMLVCIAYVILNILQNINAARYAALDSITQGALLTVWVLLHLWASYELKRAASAAPKAARRPKLAVSSSMV